MTATAIASANKEKSLERKQLREQVRQSLIQEQQNTEQPLSVQTSVVARPLLQRSQQSEAAYSRKTEEPPAVSMFRQGTDLLS